MERAGAKHQTFHGYRRFVQIKGRLDALLEVWKLGGWEVWLWGAAPLSRETEGGGRGQRRSRRATDGARSGSRLPLRLCGSHFFRTLLNTNGGRSAVV